MNKCQNSDLIYNNFNFSKFNISDKDFNDLSFTKNINTPSKDFSKNK